MKCSVRALSILVCLFGALSTASAQWTTVAPGIEYRQFVLTAPDPAPNNVFVTRMDRNNANCIIESSLPSGQLRTGRQVVSGMATHYDDSINYWGEEWGKRSQVVAAINGDGFTWNGVGPTGGQITSGWNAWRWIEYSQSGFVWKLDRSCFLGGNVRSGNTPGHTYQFIFFAGGGNTVPTSVNKARAGGSELIVYTPQFAEHTYTDNSGTEVVIEMTRPIVPLPVGSASYVEGTIRQIRQNAGSTPIPFDHVVLSGTGSYASLLTSNCTVGEVIRFQFEVKDYGTGGHVPTSPADWTKAYASIGCFGYVLKNGIVPVNDWSSNSGAIIRNPRTAVAFNNQYVFFLVCDGRSASSVGMTYQELGNFCLNKLGATWATNQDGGGSSALWVNGQIKNVPSDGSQRPVANGLLMVVVQPKVQSTTLVPAQLVTTNGSANVRQGPGTNYGTLWTAPSGTQGQVIDHSLNGVQAKGYNWWKINFSGTVGWVAQTLLTPGPVAPRITAHPSPQTVMVGGAATFTVGAAGDAPLSYRWQKNGVNLNNGGHYSGVTTATLNVFSADMNDLGTYRCVVTNSYGSATSNAAALTLIGQPVITQHPVAQNVCTGGTAQFTILASSATPASYQWQKDNANISDGANYAGTTTPTLTVINASAGQVGSYRCVVTNAAGSTPSNQAPLALDGVFAVAAIGGTSSSITGVSTDGVVVAGNNGSGGFIWSVAQGLKQIGGSTAGVATQGSSVIVGGMNGGAASRWNGTTAGTGSWSALPLESGNAWTALCTSASGGDVWIGGNSGSTTGTRKAVRYKQSANSTAALPLPPNGNSDAYILGISDIGSYAGRYQYGAVSNSGSRQAMGGSTLTALSPLIGSPSTSNEGVANCVSRDGARAGGWSTYPGAPGGYRQATVWTVATPTVPIAVPFIDADNYSEVLALNSNGTIATGYSRQLPGGAARAIIWDATNGTRDLRSWLIAQYGLDMTGWVLTEAKGMSGDGKVIAGNGTYNGVTQAWVVLLGAPGQAPTIAQHPVAQNLCPGGDATFTVAATGLGTLSFQWQHNSANIADGERYSGSWSPQLTISGVASDDAGSYRCVVAAGCSTSISTAAALTVRTGTSISGQPSSRNACVGTTVQFTVSATGEGALSYQWRKGGQDLDDDDRISGATSPTLTIADVEMEDAGSYDCVVTAGCGPAATSPAILTVSTPVGPDLDDDCDVDIDDLTLFLQCAGQAGVAPAQGCASRDFDGDDDVDMDDFGVFQRCYSGAGNTAPEGCAD